MYSRSLWGADKTRFRIHGERTNCPVVSVDQWKDDLPILDLGGRRSSSPPFSWTRCQEYTMGSVPEDDSHCKVRSLPSVSSPSNSHLGFDGLTSKKQKIKKSKIPWHRWTTSCWLVFPPNGQLLSVDLIVLCYLACFTSHSPKYTHFHPLHTYTASSCFQCCWCNLERLPQKLPHYFSKKKMFWSFFLIPGALLGLGGTHCGPRNLHYFWGGHAARLVGS